MKAAGGGFRHIDDLNTLYSFRQVQGQDPDRIKACDDGFRACKNREEEGEDEKSDKGFLHSKEPHFNSEFIIQNS